jgi:Peptidase family M23
VGRRDGSSGRRNGLRIALLVLALVAGGVTDGNAADTSPTGARAGAAVAARAVSPGGVVRWSGHGIESCRLADLEWKPWADACWYPIDLLQEPGALTLRRTRRGASERFTVTVAGYPYPVQHLKVAPEMTNPPPEQLERIRRESERTSAVWWAGTPLAFQLPLRPPLEPLPEARSFGSRRVFNGEPRDPHGGVDLSAPKGTPVMAAERGRVVIAANHYFSGNSVFIDHGDDLVTVYFHLDRIDVIEGDAVERGQVIGTVGSTGRVTGPHLHFGARWHGARIDPTLLLGDPGRVPEIGPADSD